MATILARTMGALAAVAVAGCGGGGGSGQTAGIDRGGSPVPAAVSGTATGFGSIVVNGQHYATSGAAILVDGAPALEADIKPGHVVTIVGTIDSAGNRSAARVGLMHDVEGPIGSIDPLASRLVVLGQTIIVDAATSFDTAIPTRSLEGLAENTPIEVSGFRDAGGTLRASRISLDQSNDPYRVRGALGSVDTAARTARLNGLTIDYRTATLEGFATGQPAQGDHVIAEGAAASGTLLVASRLTRSSASPLDLSAANTAAEVEGLITRYAGARDFDVDGQRVSTSPQTAFLRGSAADLALDVRVEVRGTAVGGALSAAEVALAPAITTRIQGDVEAVDAAARTITVLGTLVRVLPDTTVEDARDDERVFDVTDLRVGDQVEIHGYEDPPSSGRVVAVRLEREDDGGAAELTGIVRSVADPQFFILGVQVLTGPNTEFDDISRSDFFANGVGMRVDVEGAYANGILTADEVEPAD